MYVFLGPKNEKNHYEFKFWKLISTNIFFSLYFLVSNGGGTQTFHLRASSEVERQRWVTALELAKAKAIQRMESEDDESIMGGM